MLTESLKGIRVIEVGTTVVAPYAAQAMGAMGADVVKVEPPGGDPFRNSEPSYDSGMAGYFALCNCEKRSIEIDLKTDDGLAVFYELAETADVFIENLRPGTANKLGIGYEDVKSKSDDIIYCSISGYGESGPWSQRPAYDPILQGASGLMSVTGPEGGPPCKVGTAIIDLTTALWSVINILSALYKREHTGSGDYIEMSMLDVGVSLLTKQATVSLIQNETPQPLGTHDLWVVPYGAFPTKDGEQIIIGTPTQNQWEHFCSLIDREDLVADDRFESRADRVEHRNTLNEILEREVREKTKNEWMDLLLGEIPVGPILSVDEAISNEQAEHNNVLGKVSHGEYGEVDVLNLPIRSDDDRQEFRSPPPMLGEDGIDILLELGYDDDQIQSLKEREVI